MIGYINILVDFLILNKDKISDKAEDMWPRIFYKVVRLMSVTMLYKESIDLHHKLVSLAKYAWEKHKKRRL